MLLLQFSYQFNGGVCRNDPFRHNSLFKRSPAFVCCMRSACFWSGGSDSTSSYVFPCQILISCNLRKEHAQDKHDSSSPIHGQPEWLLVPGTFHVHPGSIH